MASPASATGSSPGPAGETPAQEKARLRRERRNQKIQAGGATRLQAITGLNGGSHRSTEPTVAPSVLTPQSTPSPAPPRPTASHPDPAEIDISQHHYTPASRSNASLTPFDFNGMSTPPFAPGVGAEGDASADPMMMMLQQMMGGGGTPFGPGGAPQQGGNGSAPPGMAQILQAMQGGDSQEPPASDRSAQVWAVVHALFSFALSLYMLLQTPFTGSKLSRTGIPSSKLDEGDWTVDSSPGKTFKHFFYLFATFEVMLQTTRFFMEKGQLQGGGMLSTISQVLPEPWAGYVRLVGRYAVIWQTVVSDAMVVVFVLGAACWWNGGVVS